MRRTKARACTSLSPLSPRSYNAWHASPREGREIHCIPKIILTSLLETRCCFPVATSPTMHPGISTRRRSPPPSSPPSLDAQQAPRNVPRSTMASALTSSSSLDVCRARRVSSREQHGTSTLRATRARASATRRIAATAGRFPTERTYIMIKCVAVFRLRVRPSHVCVVHALVVSCASCIAPLTPSCLFCAHDATHQLLRHPRAGLTVCNEVSWATSSPDSKPKAW